MIILEALLKWLFFGAPFFIIFLSIRIHDSTKVLPFTLLDLVALFVGFPTFLCIVTIFLVISVIILPFKLLNKVIIIK